MRRVWRFPTPVSLSTVAASWRSVIASDTPATARDSLASSAERGAGTTTPGSPRAMRSAASTKGWRR
jgi:hypothetical protein